jgi:hypothetical protein
MTSRPSARSQAGRGAPCTVLAAPGGGGQVSDVGKLEYSKGIAMWHLLDNPSPIRCGHVTVHVEREHRFRAAQLHTDTHLLNTLIFDHYSGALVTGAQINGGWHGTHRLRPSRCRKCRVAGARTGVE